MFSAKSIRIISFIGILLLLVFQYTWFQNSYALMEMEVMEKCDKALKEAIDEHMFERIKSTSLKVKVKDDTDNKSTDVITENKIDHTNEINNQIQEILILLGKPTSIPRVDTLYHEKLNTSLGFVPTYKIQLVNDSIKKLHESSKYTIYNKIVDNQYIEVALTSPLGSILRRAQYIVILSILLVLMIGVILMMQLRSMLRENRFVSFIKDYTHALTHELKTPISGIYMSASQLVSGKLEDKPESRQHYYQICQEQSSKLLKTVERILLVAKAEHTAILPNKDTVEVKPFVDKIADNFRQNNFRQKQLEIQTHFSSDQLMGFFDTFLIENVLSNLIDNAVKYSDTTVKIEISCTLTEKSLRLSVKDNGFGISEKEIKHIFNNFERGDKIERRGIDGFGIGLNYVQKVIKAHKGTISVKSEEGKGSEFIIELPSK